MTTNGDVDSDFERGKHEFEKTYSVENLLKLQTMNTIRATSPFRAEQFSTKSEMGTEFRFYRMFYQRKRVASHPRSTAQGHFSTHSGYAT